MVRKHVMRTYRFTRVAVPIFYLLINTPIVFIDGLRLVTVHTLDLFSFEALYRITLIILFHVSRRHAIKMCTFKAY